MHRDDKIVWSREDPDKAFETALEKLQNNLSRQPQPQPSKRGMVLFICIQVFLCLIWMLFGAAVYSVFLSSARGAESLSGPVQAIGNPQKRCRQTVYCFDHQTRRVRKLIRFESWPTDALHSSPGKNRPLVHPPGSGSWGAWQEAFCEPLGAKVWRYKHTTWPKHISQQEVARLLSEKVFWFERQKQARGSCWWDFTGLGYQGTGPKGQPIKREI